MHQTQEEDKYIGKTMVPKWNVKIYVILLTYNLNLKKSLMHANLSIMIKHIRG
jgi:sortase (surface protein transpeptidase)